MEAAPLLLQPGEQANFIVAPNERRPYHFQTFGSGKLVMMLFEERDGELRTVAADDNTGSDRGAYFEADIDLALRYVLRIRLFERQGDTVLMMW